MPFFCFFILIYTLEIIVWIAKVGPTLPAPALISKYEGGTQLFILLK